MEDTWWKNIAYAWFILQSLCTWILLEILILGKPYITLFWIILGVSLHRRIKKNRDLPIARYWPFIRKK
ncbi:MAG: hypothetical protein AAB874_04680 [Patescibacteria group bacterium]